MIQVFEFQDFVTPDWSFDRAHVERVDINEEIKSLVKEGYSIKNVSLTILQDHRERYECWDKKIYLVIAEKEVLL